MEIKNEIKGYITMEGMTISSVAEELGIKQMRYKDVIHLARILGYKIKWEKMEE